MLAAFKNTTVTHLQQSIVMIKGMEFNYWLGTFESITKQSAMLTGFTFAGLAGAAGADT